MRIGVPRESRPRETRVAATPKTVGQLVGLGYDVVVEAGAGAAASFSDEAYAAAGARVVDAEQAWSSDVVHKVNAPSDEEISRLRPGTVLVSLMAPALSPELVEKLRAAGVTAMAMDAVPRISRAQSLDVLSSMANIAGYRAVVEAAHEFGSFFTGQVTAAGKVPPAKVLVAGAGVAGLAAIGTARSLGAIVRATDARAEVAEQVRVDGRRVPRRADARGRGGRRLVRRLRQGDGRGVQPASGRALCRAGPRRRHHRDDGPHPGASGTAAHHRRDGGRDEAGHRSSSTWRRPTAATSRARSPTRWS